MAVFNLSIREILRKPCFENAKLIAGEKGVNRVVRWVHIMEVTDIGKLLNGSELILSTGLGWRHNNEKSVSFLYQLIKSNVSGLCVELVNDTKGISAEMIEVANNHDFPIIIFQNEVRFIDITQDINTSLMNIQYKILSDIEVFSKELNQLLLKPYAFKSILRLLHDYLKVNVLYIQKSDEDYYYLPYERHVSEDEILLKIKKDDGTGVFYKEQQGAAPDGTYIRQFIQALGHTFSEVIIFSTLKTLGEFETLVLDRCAIAISQDLVRKFYIEEQKRRKEHQWVQEWLNGRYSEEEIYNKVINTALKISPKGCAVCVIQIDNDIEESALSYYLGIFRNLLTQHGFYVYASYEMNRIILCLLDLRGKKDWMARLTESISQMLLTEMFKGKKGDQARIGVGSYFVKLDKVTDSYSTAIEAIQIIKRAQIQNEIFYENLHAYRIASLLHKEGVIHHYIEEYLGPLIRYDQAHKGDLINTLKVFLEVNGSKKLAAKELFVVRQTLYHRLTKIEELLGQDYMERSKRVAIEIALLCHHYVHQNDVKTH